MNAKRYYLVNCVVKINFDYLNIFKEPVLFGAYIVRHALQRKAVAESDAILIVNTSLVGEFAASAPALSAVIQKNTGHPIDLLVSPPLVPFARHVCGVRTVYGAASVFARENERAPDSEKPHTAYAKIIILRMSPDAYRMLGAVQAAHVETGFLSFVAYGFHLGWNLLRGKTPRPFRDVVFAMVGETPRNIPFDDIFNFSAVAYERATALHALQTEQKKVLIHTGASWLMNHWRTDNWITLLEKLHGLDDFRFIFVGTRKDEEEEYAFIATHLPFPVYSLIRHLDLVGLTAVMHASDYFIGVDSGPRNLAHLVGLPSITLLGPGPHMYTPSDPRDIVLDHSRGRGLYQRFLRKDTNRYIDRVTPREVYEAFQDHLYEKR